MSKTQLIQFAAPSEAVIAESVAAMRTVASASMKVTRARASLSGDKPVQTALGILCRNAARYVLGILAENTTLRGEALEALTSDVKEVFNGAVRTAFGKAYTNSVKVTLSTMHSVILDPATTVLFGQGWRDEKYGSEIAPVSGDKPARLTFWEGRKRMNAAKRPQTAQAKAKAWLLSNAKRASNSRTFYGMIQALVENLLRGNDEPATEPVKAPKTRRQPAKQVPAEVAA